MALEPEQQSLDQQVMAAEYREFVDNYSADHPEIDLPKVGYIIYERPTDQELPPIPFRIAEVILLNAEGFIKLDCYLYDKQNKAILLIPAVYAQGYDGHSRRQGGTFLGDLRLIVEELARATDKSVILLRVLNERSLRALAGLPQSSASVTQRLQKSQISPLRELFKSQPKSWEYIFDKILVRGSTFITLATPTQVDPETVVREETWVEPLTAEINRKISSIDRTSIGTSSESFNQQNSRGLKAIITIIKKALRPSKI